MNYKFLLPISLGIFSIHAEAQTLERDVISNFGITYSNNGVVFQQTLSQIAVKTLDSPSNTLTQGFQQAEINIIKTDDFAQDVELTFFPNPTTQLVNYKLDKGLIEQGELYLFSMNAQLIATFPLNKEGGTIDLSHLADGTYVLSVKNQHNLLKSFQIIKLTK
jgi:Secretion system C-terminal sorting domain